ncbi:MAG: glycosyltransferase family 4 protein [Chromatiales bacterium]|jgi:glycosyltransferase involved in cell wall biosynthesis|nr:glycosyltransferase family 4 protein [Chromatiales bacterium]
MTTVIDNRHRTAVICLSPNKGGMELDAAKLARLLSAELEIVLIIKRGGYLDIQHAQPNQDHHYLVETVDFKSMFSLALISQLHRIFISQQIRNVIFFGASELKSLYFALLGLDVNLIVRHGTTKRTPKKDWFHRRVYAPVKAHIVISNHLEKNIRSILHIPAPTEVALIYPSFAYSTPEYQPPANPVRLIHVGRICAGKGQDVALRVCQKLKTHNIDFELTFLGDINAEPAEFSRLQSLVVELGLQNQVRFAGHVQDVHSHLLQSDVFLFPSAGEGFGNVIAEALFSGLVPIVFDNTSIPEIRQNLGFYLHAIEDGNEDAMAETLMNVCKEIVQEKRRAYANVKLAASVFAEERERGQYLALLARISDQRQTSAKNKQKNSSVHSHGQH